MEIKSHFFDNDGTYNLIFGQSHFIKTIEDIPEIIASTVPSGKFGVAFCEASGPSLIRYEGNDKDLTDKAINFAKEVASGHTFVIFLKDIYPINILTKIKNCDEVAKIFCATANPLTVLTVSENGGAGVIGVIDGSSPKGVENSDDKQKRSALLRKIGYKF